MPDRAVTLFSAVFASALRFPGYLVERWFGVFLAGWGLLCVVEPSMFDAMPQAFESLRGPRLNQEWHYAILFVALGAFQFTSARQRDSGQLVLRAVAATVAASALFGLAYAFVIRGTITSGTYTYGFLGASELFVLVRLLVIRSGARRGLTVESRYFVQTKRAP